jgi:hypothetical protein
VTAKLQWALVNGQPLHIRTLLNTRPGERPDAVCPGCAGPVDWHIGERGKAGLRAPHVQHRANTSTCGATEGESAAHLDAKWHLARKLAECRALSIVSHCDRGHDIRRQWQATEWDAVEVEYRVGSTRPDIVLLRDGAPVAAVEVRHSHAVDARKADKFAALGIPWVEIETAYALAWTGTGCVRVVDTDDDNRPLACAVCEARRVREARLAEEARERAAALIQTLDTDRIEREERSREHWMHTVRERNERLRLESAREDLERQRQAEAQEAEAAAKRAAAALEAASRRFDYAASRAHWDAVFAELRPDIKPWRDLPRENC